MHTGPGTPTDTSIKGVFPGMLPQFNTFRQYSLKYSHNNLFGGELNILAYKATQRSRFNTECGTSDCKPYTLAADNLNRGKQDPNIAPLGTLLDASELHSDKSGVRSSWNTDSFAGVTGLGLNAGLDLVKDTTEQRLAMTNRLWVPPMKYSSTAPFAQLSYDAGPLTVSGGASWDPDGETDTDTVQELDSTDDFEREGLVDNEGLGVTLSETVGVVEMDGEALAIGESDK